MSNFWRNFTDSYLGMGDCTVSYDEDKPLISCADCGEGVHFFPNTAESHRCPDVVNHPPHYTQGGVECIDAIDAALGEDYRPYYIGQVMKYVWRAPLKGNTLEDLKKAQWYLNRLIDKLTM